MSAPPTILRRYIDAILNGLYNHLIPNEAYIVLASDPWVIVHDYIKWFYQVSHPYMTPDAA